VFTRQGLATIGELYNTNGKLALVLQVGRETPLYNGRAVRDHNPMPQSDFDLPSLARYLHLSPDKVAKLADRKHLPGRKVAGEWKFARADIHHWLERRIGA
jgi:excisionase family DNA binding protein